MQLGFVLHMAARDLRGARRELLPLAGAVTVGVAALVAMNSLAANLHDSIDKNAQAVSRLASYLGLLAVGALLLGGVGVASAAVIFVRQRRQAIAVLRCLGATAKEVLALYLFEVALLGIIGGSSGALAGVGVQQLVAYALRHRMSWLEPALAWPAIATGIAMGAWVAIAFALVPLLPIRRLQPLAALRRDYELEPRDPLRWLPVVVLIATVVALAAVQVGSWRVGAASVGAGFVALLPLWLASRGLVRLARTPPPRALPFAWRQGVANLHRPANQTATVVLSIGIGAFLLSTLFLIQHNMLRQLRAPYPNLILTGIRTDQLLPLERELQKADVAILDRQPSGTMRILSVKGQPAGTLRASRSDTSVLTQEYRLNSRDSLVISERVIAGQWWRHEAKARAARAVILISVDAQLASALGVGVGDEIAWEVEGKSIVTEVANLRQGETRRGSAQVIVNGVPLVERGGEAILVDPSALSRIPHTFVLFARTEQPVKTQQVREMLAARYGNVESQDFAMLLNFLEKVMHRVIQAVQFTGVFILGAGVLVLVATLATSRFHRIREGALLRALGATRGQLLRIVFTEYLALGSLAVIIGVVLSAIAAWGASHYLFKAAFSLPIAALGTLTLSTIGLTVMIGMMHSREVLSQPPLEVLRAE